ncbi:MAG: EAL domain-containing protein [Acetobacteraceae bacterium]|nr:EAL domain-containing protein [Acetobacteraceae bacterium]
MPGIASSLALQHSMGQQAGARPPVAPELDRLALAVEAVFLGAAVRRAAPATDASPSRTGAGLTYQQTACALRFALAEYTGSRLPEACRSGIAPGLAGRILEAESRARAARDLIADRRFHLVYQPVVCLADRRVHHFEALLRPWHVAGAPFCNTQDFVTFSEAMGLSEELDGAVLERAIAPLSKAPGPPVAINISGQSVQSPAFRQQMLALAASRPGRFLVELTETAQIDDLAGAAATLEKLRAAGVPVCIDDFGAGAAAFRYLREFEVDYLKVDGPYVQGAANNRQDRNLVASIIELARSVGVRVIAEMIETEEQARVMQEMGVDLGQGWLYGPGGTLPSTSLWHRVRAKAVA